MTNQLVTQLGEREARQLTNEVKTDAASLWRKLVVLNEGGAHTALGYGSWQDYCAAEFGMKKNDAYQQLNAGRVVAVLEAHSANCRIVPNEGQARVLAPLRKQPEKLAQAWDEAIETSNGRTTAETIKKIVDRLKSKKSKKIKPADDDFEMTLDREKRPRATFNQVNDNIGWARWSWNPVTGCKHNCDYCYAREITERFASSFAKGFAPDFHPERLSAPQYTQIPKEAANEKDPEKAAEWHRVFTCSMADLFGKWVPQKWIDAVFGEIVAAPQWEFLCLTKFPQRLSELEWPDNAWVGTTVDKQHRVDVAQRSFANVKAGVKWLSCEPLLEPLKFDSLEMFDWVVIGSSTGATSKQFGTVAPFAPRDEWVFDLWRQAREAGCKVYLKHNLFRSDDGTGPGMRATHEWPR